MKIRMDVKKFATIFAGVLLATNALSTLARADDTGKPTPDARVGNVLFQTPNPKIWTRREGKNRVIFSANLPAPDFVEITVFSGGPLNNDFGKTFEAAVNLLLKERGVTKTERDGGPQASNAREGFPVLQRNLYCETKDFHTAHWFLAGNSGGRFDMIAFETSGDEGWQAHIAEATQFFQSVKLANSLTPAQIPATLRTGDIKGGAATTPPVIPVPAAATPFAVGSKVEGYQSTSSKWLTGTIAEIKTDHQHKGPYHVVFDDKTLTFPDEWLEAVKVRVAGQYTGKYVRGARVDVISKLDRGTIIEVKGFDYKIHFDGCKAYWDAWYDGADLRPAASITASHAEVKFLIGKWTMFQPGAPNTIVHGDTVYREYGLGAKAPPLQINANGTYVWKEDFGAPATSGAWKPSAKIKGREENGRKIESQGYAKDGLIIKAKDGSLWRVTREIYKGKATDSITLLCLCQGLQLMGTRK